MKMHDIHSDKKIVILLIHQMIFSAKEMKRFIAEPLGEGYRYLIPDLSNHGTAEEEIYQSARLEAEAIHGYLIEKGVQEIQLGFGASVGGIVLFELLKYPDLHFRHLFFEGVSFYEKAPFLNYIGKILFLAYHTVAIQKPSFVLKQMKRFYGEEEGEKILEAFIILKRESIKNTIYDCSFVSLPELSLEQQKKCTFAYGEKDRDLKQFQKIQTKKYPKVEVKIWKGYQHCLKMMQDSRKYAEILRTYL